MLQGFQPEGYNLVINNAISEMLVSSNEMPMGMNISSKRDLSWLELNQTNFIIIAMTECAWI